MLLPLSGNYYAFVAGGDSEGGARKRRIEYATTAQGGSVCKFIIEFPIKWKRDRGNATK